MHLDPDIEERLPRHRLLKMAAFTLINPRDITLNDQFTDGDETIDVDWQATADPAGIADSQLDSPDLKTLTMHNVPIEETGESITADFDKKPDGTLVLSIQEGAKADKLQVMSALWKHLGKVRKYYNHELDRQEKAEEQSGK